MAKEKMPDSKSGEGDKELVPLPREVGNSGLKISAGVIQEQCQKELRWPQAMKTFKAMESDPSIRAALEYVDNKILNNSWVVKTDIGVKKETIDRAAKIRQMMDDMEHPWTDFIRAAATHGRYGFAPVAKTYRYRNLESGSRYNDNVIGIRSLKLRSQDSIICWKTSKGGKVIDGFYQNVMFTRGAGDSLDGSLLYYGQGGHYSSDENFDRKFIPRDKYLLFRHNPYKDNPEGNSPLSGVYAPWKYKCAYQESEALSVAQDANAFKILYIPPEYMVEDAPEDKKQAFIAYTKMMQNAHQAKQSGMILPLLHDQDGNKMFEFDIKNVTGGKGHNTNDIIERFNKEILIGLFADVLALGASGGGGSYSLSESKMSVIDQAVLARLNEIKNQLNHDLIPQIYDLNGWDKEELPYFDFEVFDKHGIDNVSKFVQRVAATGFLPRVPSVVNWIMRQAGIDFQVPENMTTEELDKILSPVTTRAGDGMKEGLGNGTGKSDGGSGDNSAGNKEGA